MKKIITLLTALLLPFSLYAAVGEEYFGQGNNPPTPVDRRPLPYNKPKSGVKLTGAYRTDPFDLNSPIVDNYRNWGFTRINAANAHEAGLTGKGVNIMIMDSGVIDHPEFNGKNIVMIDVGAGSFDNSGHGTGVAGILISAGQQLKGITPDATIYSVKVDKGLGIVSPDFVLKALNWATEQRKKGGVRIDVINLSYGSPSYDPSIAAAIKAAYDAGITLVASGGNDGKAVKFPATMNEVLAVYGLTPHNGGFRNSSFGTQIDFTAPAETIFTTGLNHSYTWANGTSVAAPYITGQAAMAIQAYRLANNGKSPSPAEVKSLLISSSSKLASLYPERQGNGVIDSARISKILPTVKK